ncbi:Reverse transcriptase zinc-binding domain [Macleaya cordata]|uniref:Reverse transcriptase zinc-binding domain n=1 Tax=Macleaya cordata TaxID=56857 RepID=A0A200Q047_MACCD|nr:Reverse transcriptase zinc-binding domain [Macleaya cordata]
MGSIHDMIISGENGYEWNLDLKRSLRAEEQGWMTDLITRLGDPPHLSQDSDDEVDCTFSNNTLFSTKECYELSCREGAQQFPVQLVWKKLIPSKVSFFVWSATLNAIQTTDNVRRRVCWGLWLERNGRVFEGKENQFEDIILNIKSIWELVINQ